MFGFLMRLVSGAVTPLTDQVADVSARLLRKLALFLLAGICLLVVVIALTIAFDLWISKLAGSSIIGAMAVAGLYLSVALMAIWLALRGGRKTSSAQAEADTPGAKASAALGDEIDAFTGPLLATLQRLGLRREQLAVLAGASVAKQIGPLPLVGLAILAGFLIGRLATSWRSLIPFDLVDDLLSSGIFGYGASAAPSDTKDAA